MDRITGSRFWMYTFLFETNRTNDDAAVLRIASSLCMKIKTVYYLRVTACHSEESILTSPVSYSIGILTILSNMKSFKNKDSRKN